MSIEVTKFYLAIILIGFLTILWHKSYHLTKDNDLEEKIDYLKENFGYPKSNFILPVELKKLLLDRNFDPMSIRKLVSCIMEHLNISMFGVDVIIEYNDDNLHITDNSDKNYSKFIRDENEIRLNIKSYYALEHIVTLTSYQCIYYYISCSDINISNNPCRETLLEIAAIYLGFGNFTSRAHTPIERIVEERAEGNMRVITKEVSIIGHLNAIEINYVINRVSELKLLSIVKDRNMNRSLISKKNI
ncbi:hypothetical protein [Clostridium sp. UBA1056]|uniref:hypothetical protein n=1 Tax=unclassified Clostridium TaxID=2614128 RepID=UPI0032180F43